MKMADGDKKQRPLRIADVAALAGVSTATVSRALTDPDKLTPATLARVESAVRQTGYTPNLAARSLRARRTMLVLVVVPDIANPFFSDVLLGIDDALSRAGYGLLIGNLGPAGGKERHLLQVVQAGQVDGVILLNGAILTDGKRTLAQMDVPLVAVCEAIPGADFPQIEVENRAAATAAVAYLVSLGHRRLAYLGGPGGNILEQERQAGFVEGLGRQELPAAEAQFYPGDFTFQGGVAAAHAMLAKSTRPTALFAANDEMAIGFLKTVREAGLGVPEDISVVGFDGIGFADYVDPVLTTFRQPRRSLGHHGADLLVRMMMGQSIPSSDMHVLLPVELLVRASTGPLA
jgi:LacI family repressor for deo operon, udp, cdd, tsx, nupC, and nupG